MRTQRPGMVAIIELLVMFSVAITLVNARAQDGTSNESHHHHHHRLLPSVHSLETNVQEGPRHLGGFNLEPTNQIRRRRHHRSAQRYPANHPETNCHHGDGDGQERKVLRGCYGLLRGALVRFSRVLKREENDTRALNFDVCGSLEDVFSNCSLLLSDDVTRHCVSRDESIKKKMETFTVLMEHFGEFCEKNHADSNKYKQSKDLQACFREEYRGSLSIRCDDYFEFNVEQGTRDECFFLRERFKCQESLLDSSCGSSSSSFNFHFLSIISDKQLSKFNCSVIKEDPTFEAFKYDHKSCKKGMIRRLEWCTSTHLDAKMVVEFHKENDLVALGSPWNVRNLCGAYNGFKKCIMAMNESCSEVVSLFLQYEATLRQYMLKMNFICSRQILPVYSSNLKCLRSSVGKKRLSKCDVHWYHFKPYLENISSVQFFCSPLKPSVVKMKKELSTIHSCHGEVFTARCGPDVGHMMVQFLQLVLNDPFYLRYSFQPNCSLHGIGDDGHIHLDLFNLPEEEEEGDENDEVDVTSGADEQDHVTSVRLHVTSMVHHSTKHRLPSHSSTTDIVRTEQDIFFSGETLVTRDDAVDVRLVSSNSDGNRLSVSVSPLLMFPTLLHWMAIKLL